MIDAYLKHLGVARREPSLDYLFELHRAQVERVPYTNLDIMTGRPGTVDQLESVQRVLEGRGGYCFQVNGALAWLLRELGFSLTMHRGWATVHDGETPLRPNHLALLVHDLGDPHFVDAGLGDAIHEPMPLRAGDYPQGPFTYRLDGDGYFHHADGGSFLHMRFEPAACRIDDFAESHRHLSTSPESSFTQTFTAQRRDESGVDILRGRLLTRWDSRGKTATDLGTYDQWCAVLAGTFGIPTDGLAGLWAQVLEAHEKWLMRQN